MNRAFLLLFALIAGVSAWGQGDTSAPATSRDSSGFLPLSSPAPAMASGQTNAPAPADTAAPAVPAPVETTAPAAPVPGVAAMTTTPPTTLSPEAIPPAGQDTNFVTSSLVASQSVYNMDDRHKLAPGDQISFQIIEDRTNPVQMLVAESSELDIPYIGRMSVADKTCKQLAAQVKTLLEKDYYYTATVIIGLDKLNMVAGKVYVIGPVNHPGSVEIPANENFTVAKAILLAGGPGDFANLNKVKIVRKTANGGTQVITANVAEAMRGKTEEDVTVQDGDEIIVPQRLVNIGQ